MWPVMHRARRRRLKRVVSRGLCALLLLFAQDFSHRWHGLVAARVRYQSAAVTFAELDARNNVTPALTYGLHPRLANQTLSYGPPSNPRWTELFDAGGPHWHDVRQGHVGDCYLMASLASLAYASPKLLMHNIHADADGNSYTVTFFAPQGGESLMPVHVKVDTALPMRAHGLAYAATVPGQDTQMHADGKRVLWVALYEKAFSAFLSTYIDHRPNGYAALERTTFSYLAFGYLTGSYAEPIAVTPQTQEAIWQTLMLANKGVPMTAGSQASVTLNNGLTPRHAYTVLQAYVDPATQERSVLMRDPTGMHPTLTPHARNLGDGMLQISLHDFIDNFARLNVAMSMAPARAYASQP